MSIIRTIHRTTPYFGANEYTPGRVRSGGFLPRQAIAREVLSTRPLVAGERYSTNSTSSSLNFNPYWGLLNSSPNYDASYWYSYRRRNDLAIMAFRNLGNVTNVAVSNSEKHSLSGINSGAADSSNHQLNLFLGAWPRELENSSPHTYSRTGGGTQLNCQTLLIASAANSRLQGQNYATAVQSVATASITFPEFQPRQGNSLLLYIATIQIGTGGSPYFTTWNAPGLTRAGGSSSNLANGYQTGTSSAGYGAVVIMPYSIDSGQPDLIAPVTCNISAFTTSIAAIVEIEPGVDYSRL